MRKFHYLYAIDINKFIKKLSQDITEIISLINQAKIFI
jgi:hypothetical protein